MSVGAFYAVSEGMFLEGLEVAGPGYYLHIDLKDTYTYPVHGWHWFATRSEAVRTLFDPVAADRWFMTNALQQAGVEYKFQEVDNFFRELQETDPDAYTAWVTRHPRAE